MELNLGRIGSWLSDRIVLAVEGEEGANLAVKEGGSAWFSRAVSWIRSPSNYSKENRAAVAAFQKFVTKSIGPERLQRICTRYGLDLEAMRLGGSPLLTRDIAKIFTGMQVVNIQDMEELIQLAKGPIDAWPAGIDPEFRIILSEVENSEELDSQTFSEVYDALKNPIDSDYSLPDFQRPVHGGMPTEFLACFYFEPFLADQERLYLNEDNPDDDCETFIHNFVTRTIHREMDVGMVIPAPKHRENGQHQFFRVAAKIVTGEGQVSYGLVPATEDTDLKPIRFYRGTSARPCAIDAASTVITDLEKDLGERAFQSGQIYESVLERTLPRFEIQAGHSLGSTILQKKLVKDSTIREAYLYNGPGVTEENAARFNERMGEAGVEPVKLIIRDTHSDTFSLVGKVHLGYKSPEETVAVDYKHYHAPFGIARKNAGYAHTTVWGRETRYYGLEGFSREGIDEQLNRKELSASSEKLRETIGPIIAMIVRILRDFFHWVFGSRAEEQRGIQIGRFVDGRWTTDHIRPEEIQVAPQEALV